MAKSVKKTDIEDLWEALDGAMTSVQFALDALKDVQEYAEWFNVLDDVLYEMKAEFELVDNEVASIEAAELRAKNREYEASVL